jgi:hypothetical protein
MSLRPKKDGMKGKANRKVDREEYTKRKQSTIPEKE